MAECRQLFSDGYSFAYQGRRNYDEAGQQKKAGGKSLIAPSIEPVELGQGAFSSIETMYST